MTISEEPRDFIRQIVDDDLAGGKHDAIVTRFPPEPNGYLHIGHAKSICLNFGLAEEYSGRCNLRYDDTNPAKEEVEYVEAIEDDVRWLGFGWAGKHFASDYFERLYVWAEGLIERGLAYVDESSPDEIREQRGTLTSPGVENRYRSRPAAESLDLFRRMRAGEFPDGAKVLRAKIDMASPNLNLRDPVLYRIKRVHHHRTGDVWPIYPMYDYAHPLSDAIEGITHSICTLEFEDHRPLYDWLVANVPTGETPRQIEFARLNLTHTVLSKRKLLLLVGEGHVRGWDDPRMPTISGMRRRGYTPAAIRAFCERIGVAKRDSIVDFRLLEHFVREDLNRTSPRLMAVLRPLKVVLENWPEGKVDRLDIAVNPEDPEAGTRAVPIGRTLWIDRDDFRLEPPPKYWRLSPGREVRLRGGYFVTCKEAVTDASGEVVELRCTYDPETRTGAAPDGRKVKATISWVSAEHAVDAEVRLYGPLFSKENPADDRDGKDWREHLDPASLEVVSHAKVEGALDGARPGDRFQFVRIGYFCLDPDSRPGAPVFNRTVTLKDAWSKIEKAQGA